MTMKRLSHAAVSLALGLGAILAAPASAQEKSLTFSAAVQPAPREPLIVGVATHFGIGGSFNYVPEKAAALIRELGVDSFRDDLAWPVFYRPPAPGGPKPRALFQFMGLTPARPLLILSHSNPAVPEGTKPLASEAARKAFADFSVQAATATAASNPIFEIWNEWNLGGGKMPPWLIGPGTPDDSRAAVHYAALARTVLATLPAARPGVRVLSGAAGNDPGWGWTKAIVADGAISGATGLSVHLYNHCEADLTTRNGTDIADRATTLETALRQQTGGAVPLYITEFGWPTVRRGCLISRQQAADNIAQVLLWSAGTPWVRGVWIYQLKDQGTNPDDIEDNFGLYDYNHAPKPAACAVREAVALIKGARGFRLERPFPNLFILQAAMAEGVRLVTWTTRAETRGELRLDGAPSYRARPLCGEAMAGYGPVAVGPQPIVIDLPAGQVAVRAKMLP
ncbi:hypothetical protein [Xanthobacter autotrophicus]|uniref:hypothetical protein n=1 Tax=Xanthobacter autotrophicus TaxID=280 RepID=UPI00372AA6A5